MLDINAPPAFKPRAALPTCATAPHCKFFPVCDYIRREAIKESQNEFDPPYIDPFDNPTTAAIEGNTTKLPMVTLDDT